MPTLQWLGRDADLRAHEGVATRLLVEEPDMGAGGPGGGAQANLLVQGDNLQALKALLPFYAGAVRCIYIDPPYNTGSAFAHYDDNLEHATWLSLMVPRLQLLREFLREDGSIWVSIDDREGHYLKVVMDEVFGRRNFVANVVWQKRIGPDSRLTLGDAHENLLVYCRAHTTFAAKANKLTLTDEQRAEFRNPDNDPRGPWTSSSNFSAQGYRPNQMYTIRTPGGAEYGPPPGRCWVNVEPEYLRLREEGRLWFGRDGRGMPRKKMYLSETEGRPTWTWWGSDEVGNTQESKKESIDLFGGESSFGTPKPERLLQRILHIATDPGDLVLDSFLGSGTTAAVAHKMGRPWIGVEMGDHARTHCALRLRRVVEGEQGGISQAVGWQGGGGFRFATLGPALFDAQGRIDPAIRYGDLAAHVWFAETRTPLPGPAPGAPLGPVLGRHGDRHVALLYNGVLRDRAPRGGNVLTHATLGLLREAAPEGPLTVYASASRLGPDTLRARAVTFRQTPFDLRGGA